jgi:hypothetical protein
VRNGLLISLGWVAAASAATAVSWSAVSVVRPAVEPHRPASRPGTDESSGSRPLGAAPVRPISASAGATTTHSNHSGRTADLARQRVTGAGGSVVFRCEHDLPVYLNVTPQAGFSTRTDGSKSNEIRFEGGAHRTEIVITCIGNVPRWSVNEVANGTPGPGGPTTGAPVSAAPAAPAATSPAGGEKGGGGNKGPGGGGHGGHGGGGD